MTYADLPDGISYGIDVAKLGRVFDKTTNSYKFFFFLAVLDWLREEFRSFGSLSITTDYIARRMAINAWYPAVFYGLSLGVQDKLAEVLRATRNDLMARGERFTVDPESALTGFAEGHYWDDLRNIAQRFVPFRFLQAFFSRELSGLPDARKNLATLRLADEEGHHPYRIVGTASKAESIELFPAWAAYLATHQAILREWARWHLVSYVGARNPFAVDIPAKLQPPERGSLARERRLFAGFLGSRIGQESSRCIYSGRRIEPTNFDLDHFLPRSFVAHDRVWNLVPSDPAVNLAKSNSIPASEYLDGLVRVHWAFVRYLGNQHPRPDGATVALAQYSNDLALPTDFSSVSQQHLQERYESTVLPLMRSAELYGFATCWKHSAM